MKQFLTLSLLATLFFASPSHAGLKKCKSKLVKRNHITLEVFKAHGYTKKAACRKALRKCNRIKVAGYYRGKRLKCELKRQPLPVRPRRRY